MAQKTQDDQYRRNSDRELATIGEQVAEILRLRIEDRGDSANWRKMMESRIESIEKNVNKIMIPYRVSMWIMTIAGGAVIAESFRKAFSYLFKNL